MEKIQALVKRLNPGESDEVIPKSAAVKSSTDVNDIASASEESPVDSNSPIYSSLITGNPRMVKIVDAFITTLKDRLIQMEQTVADKQFDEVRHLSLIHI